MKIENTNEHTRSSFIPADLGFEFESETERRFCSSMLKQIPMNLDLNRKWTTPHSDLFTFHCPIRDSSSEIERNWNWKLKFENERENVRENERVWQTERKRLKNDSNPNAIAMHSTESAKRNASNLLLPLFLSTSALFPSLPFIFRIYPHSFQK